MTIAMNPAMCPQSGNLYECQVWGEEEGETTQSNILNLDCNCHFMH